MPRSAPRVDQSSLDLPTSDNEGLGDEKGKPKVALRFMPASIAVHQIRPK